MRDVLGKVTPGFIAILALVHATGLGPVDLMSDVPAEGPWLLVFYIVIIPACYLVGLGLQTAGEYLALLSSSPRPWRFLWYQSADWRDAHAEAQERSVRIETKIGPTDRGVGIKAHNERFGYLREGSGNFSLALGVIAISLLIAEPDNVALAENRDWVVVALLVGAVVLWVAHRVHQARQTQFEIGALKELGALTEERAKEMSARIPSWTGG